MGIKSYQEKNAKPMEKELAQSDIPVKRKIQNTIQNCRFPEIWHFWPIGGHWKKRIQKMKTIFLIAETAMGSPLDRCQSENL